MNLRFTDPVDPLYISVDADYADTLFVIATSQIFSRSQQNSQAEPAPWNPRKRPFEDDSNGWNQRDVRVAGDRGKARERQTKPMKVVHRTDKQSIAREMNPPPPPTAEPPPSWAVLTAAQQRQQQREQEDEQSRDQQYEDYNDYDYEFNPQDPHAQAGPSQPSRRSQAGNQSRARQKEPLFLPSSQISHLPAASQAAIIESGLGIEHMSAEELAMMLDGDADVDELGEHGDGDGKQGQSPQERQRQREPSSSLEYADEDWRMEDRTDFVDGENGHAQTRDSLELVDDDDDFEMAPTQNHDGGTKVSLFFERLVSGKGRELTLWLGVAGVQAIV